jgi:hypothetical protein
METRITNRASTVNEIVALGRGWARERGWRSGTRSAFHSHEGLLAALSAFMAPNDSGYEAKETANSQGHRCPFVRYRGRTYRSIFERISITTPYYPVAGRSGGR